MTSLELFRALIPAMASIPDATVEVYLRQLADGRVMSGRQAVALGRADTVGSRQDALEALAELAGIAEPTLFEYKPKQTFFEILNQGAASTIQGVGLPLTNARLEYRMAY